MKKFLGAAVLAAFFSLSPVALAQDEETSGTVVEVPLAADPVVTDAVAISTEANTIVVSEDNVITVPYGNWIEDIADIIGSLAKGLLAGLVPVGMYFLPSYLRIFLQPILRREAEQLIERSVDFAINGVKGAVHGKVLSVPIASKVLAIAANNVIDKGSSAVLDFIGDEEKLKQMILARLNVGGNATLQNMGVAALTGARANAERPKLSLVKADRKAPRSSRGDPKRYK